MGPVGPQGPSGVVLANSPATYDSDTQTIGIDQSAFEYLASLGYIDFDTASTASGQVGRLRWNSTDGTLDLSLQGGQVTLQVGQEMVQPVLNNTGGTLSNGRAVRITGASEGRMTVEYADADLPSKTTALIGVLTQDIADGEVGYVTTNGLVRGLDTSFGGSGDAVYVDGGGVLTAVRPLAGAIMAIGHIVSSDSIDGAIYVDVSAASIPTAGTVCSVYDSTVTPVVSYTGVYKWKTANGDYYLACDVTP
jgi:hypothetical protein